MLREVCNDCYKEMLKSQGGCCAICREKPEDESTELIVDHSPETGKVRGLLCDGCHRKIAILEYLQRSGS